MTTAIAPTAWRCSWASRGTTYASRMVGEQSLEVAAEFMPEIAFLDIGMPGIDGYELARRLRKMPFTHRPILIAVTGWAGPKTSASLVTLASTTMLPNRSNPTP